MRRRQRQEDDLHNRERWLISYADFITLLFGFFVVMYAISSVNEGKYKVLSETLSGVFNVPQRSLQPVPIGEQPVMPIDYPVDQIFPDPVMQTPGQREGEVLDRGEIMHDIAIQLEEAFDDLIYRGVVTVAREERWIEISLRNSLLFGGGDAEPHYDAFDIIERLSVILKDRDNPVRVEGFTDNLPISTPRFPSNWELSSARAAAVVRMLAINGVDPRRMAAIGYGEFQPVARNDTPEGRNRNRRVVLVIARDPGIRSAIR